MKLMIRSTLVLLALLLGLLACATAFAADRPRCEECGMYWDQSPTRIQAQLKGDKKVHLYESFACLYKAAGGTKANVASARMLDYGTDGSGDKFIDAFKASYLFDTDRLAHSMPPFTAAFSTKKGALDAQDKIHGDYATFDQVWKKLAAHFGSKP